MFWQRPRRPRRGDDKRHAKEFRADLARTDELRRFEVDPEGDAQRRTTEHFKR